MQQQEYLEPESGSAGMMNLAVASWGEMDNSLLVANLLHQLKDIFPAIRWLYVGGRGGREAVTEDGRLMTDNLFPGPGLDAILYRARDAALFEGGESDWFRFRPRLINDRDIGNGGDEWGIAFKCGDQRFLQLRRLFVPAVAFVGSGPGDPDLCTVGGIEALRHCDVCLYDALTPKELLRELLGDADALYVGKRHGRHSMKQQDICRLLVKLARQGKKVVRLKGGDPGIFGRLAEEVEILEDFQLPYRIVFGVSSLMPATTGTGMFLTRRAVSRGFTVMTPRAARGTEQVDLHNRQQLPLVFFMAVSEIPRIVEQLLEEGRPLSQPAGVVFAASTENERLYRGTLADIASRISPEDKRLPGLFIVGDTAAYCLHGRRGALAGRRVLVLGSESAQQEVKHQILGLSGRPLAGSLFRRVPNRETREVFRALRRYDWIILASRAEVHDFFAVCWDVGVDLRQIPKIIASTPEVVAALQDFCLKPELVFGQDVAGDELVKVLQPQARILCFQEIWPAPLVREKMCRNGIEFTVAFLFDYELLDKVTLPEFDCLVCHHAGLLSLLLSRWGKTVLEGKKVVSASCQVAALLKDNGFPAEVVIDCKSAGEAVVRLAASCLNHDLAALIATENRG